MSTIEIKAGLKENHIVGVIEFMTHQKTFASKMGLWEAG